MERLVEQIRRALERQDIEALADVYAEDAVLEELSALNPPEHPLTVEGREAIRERLKNDLLRDPISGWARQLESAEVVDPVETEDALAFREVRTYVAGDKHVAQHLARKKGNHIQRDRVIVVWDAK